MKRVKTISWRSAADTRVFRQQHPSAFCRLGPPSRLLFVARRSRQWRSPRLRSLHSPVKILLLFYCTSRIFVGVLSAFVLAYLTSQNKRYLFEEYYCMDQIIVLLLGCPFLHHSHVLHSCSACHIMPVHHLSYSWRRNLFVYADRRICLLRNT